MERIVSADPHAIERAARHLREGRLVAFPTETVYGLGANALDADAVARIFAAKGRPATNPLIVHIADVAALDQIARPNEDALRLAQIFWPGPLTIVLPKQPGVPDIVTAGGDTVAVRIPRHPVALALLRAVGLPIAAPSANRSESISPTRAEHVARSLGADVAMILDGGPCDVGLESTVLDLSGDSPAILRPGMVSAEEIAAVLGFPIALGQTASGAVAKSPGQMLRHYAPTSPLRLSKNVWADIPPIGRISVLAYAPPPEPLPPHVRTLFLSDESNSYASNLYSSLHLLDAERPDLILVQAPPETDAWTAVRDRLQRAAA
ncbi:threonylcarbamoyl-AMP synthase [Capsulimonas corticalis]|uniref:Threonylcarbamoyl-AMP synthase n=1 Tax=Capsulimonas corticalis TaxID=2219043 RepID=A0A402D352_9BACT|nr:L-threonylcarbamoyladenylate synthase [Capsulimonas corticalis]BDI28469.1 threonylcarbamoyl-AMP synthase [Capsulimonas corticalis]